MPIVNRKGVSAHGNVEVETRYVAKTMSVTFLAILILFTSVASDQKTNPENSYISGSNWFCNSGYKRVGNKCEKMTPEEAERQRIQIQILAAQAKARSKSFFIDGEEFTLSEISRKCEVWRYDSNYGEVECRGSKLGIIERKCEVYFSGRFETTGTFECRGSELRPLERYCIANMYSDDYADVDC